MRFDDREIWVLDIPKERSSLVEHIEYDEYLKQLLIKVRWQSYPIYYDNVPKSVFEEFAIQPSIGKYYTQFIKPNFKQINRPIMSDEKKRPPTKNQASNETRFIKMSLDVRKILKEWIRSGQTGDYLNITLHMKPDGQVDKYGNLGMITQDVPTEVYKEAEATEKGSGRKIKGPILGNGAEFAWDQTSKEGAPGSNDGAIGGVVDDLPF